MLAMCFVYKELLLCRSRGEEDRSWGGAYEQGTLDICIRMSKRNSNSTFSQQRHITMSLPRSLSGFYDLHRLSQNAALVVSVPLSLEYSKQIPGPTSDLLRRTFIGTYVFNKI